MKAKILFTIGLSLLTNTIIAQEIKNVNPKGNLYFGAEIGLNQIYSHQVEGLKSSFQGGILTEYYFSRRWSLSARLKYFETGVSFYQPDTRNTSFAGSWVSSGTAESFGNFNGAVISIPVNIKWESRIYKNLLCNLKLGFAYNTEIKSNYGNYSNNFDKNYFTKQYVGFNGGIGLSYFINNKMALYFDFENFNGGSKGNTPAKGLFGKATSYPTDNLLFNFGIKYNFKKIKE